ncbi:unnamed protein product [Urochloa decumbens]|uniref:Sulfotransferase n=1 Tax=Urochloa decumbens TaxID=240449 RepID=A0ABC9F5W2_9POAL
MSSSNRTSLSQANGEETIAETKTKHQAELYQRYANSVSSLPSAEGLSHLPLYRHHQGWQGSRMCIAGAMAANACFAARPSDIVIATLPKSGTTWIKSLLYATVRRREHPPDAAAGDHPFNSSGPHECVKFLEYQIYTGNKTKGDDGLDDLPDPRLFATHVPSVALPASVVASGCKIVYMCRDPKDTMVLFFRYEEVWTDPAAHVRRLAEFVGVPFGAEEEEYGVVDAIVRLCSFEHMRGLEVTKSGTTEFAVGVVENSSFFWRGGVGDWANHLSPEAARRIDAITEARFKGSGLNV